MSLKAIVTSFLIVIFKLATYAQVDLNYDPVPVWDTISVELASKLKLKLDVEKKEAQVSDQQVNSFLKSLIEKRYEFLVRTINDDVFVDDELFTPYLESVLQKIYRANPQLPTVTSIYALRSTVPNASSFGDGTLGFTLSLLSRLENEDQVAFIICHELAHYHRQHSIIGLRELARLNYDKDLKRQIDAVKRNPYGQYSKMASLYKQMGFSLTSHSRGHEYEADSMGFIYFSSTAYNKAAAVRVMEILDSVRYPLYSENIDFQKVFNFKDYPFKSHWIKYEKSTVLYKKDDDVDSLRTHPDCKKRASILRAMAGLWANESYTTEQDINFQKLRVMSEFESIASEYHFKQYGLALFHSLQLIERYPNNIYLQATIAKCLIKLYEYQKNHELSRVLELPDPRYPENYDRFLTFIHQLRLMELASLAYHFMITQPEVSFKDEEFLYALWLCSNLEISQLAPDEIKEEYSKNFPNGKHLKEMKTKPNFK